MAIGSWSRKGRKVSKDGAALWFLDTPNAVLGQAILDNQRRRLEWAQKELDAIREELEVPVGMTVLSAVLMHNFMHKRVSKETS